MVRFKKTQGHLDISENMILEDKIASIRLASRNAT